MNLVRGSHLVFRRTGTRFGWCLHFHVIRGDVWLLGRSEGHMVSLSGPWVSLLPQGVTGALTAATPPRRPVFKNGGRMHPSAVAVSEASSVHRRLFLCWFTGRVSVLGTVGWCEGRREASLSTCKWWGHSVSPQLDFNASSPICSNRPLIRLFLKKKKKIHDLSEDLQILFHRCVPMSRIMISTRYKPSKSLRISWMNDCNSSNSCYFLCPDFCFFPDLFTSPCRSKDCICLNAYE